MESHFVTEAAAPRARRRVVRATAINMIGPLTMLGGVAWAFLQPYRLTLLHPHGQGFWWLVIEPPLLVAFAGVVFAVFVARPLLEDLEDDATA
jgi:fructose-specific phosphotransferase system IIC component